MVWWVLAPSTDTSTADPLGTVERIYERFGLTMTDAYRLAARRCLEMNPKGKHGRHAYRPEDFGWTEPELRARFRDYEARYLGGAGP